MVPIGSSSEPLGGMTERSGSATIIAGAAEDPVPRSGVKPQEPASRIGVPRDHLPAPVTRADDCVRSWRQHLRSGAARGQRRPS